MTALTQTSNDHIGIPVFGTEETLSIEFSNPDITKEEMENAIQMFLTPSNIAATLQ